MKVFLATLNIQHNIQSSMHYTATLSSFTIALTPFAYNSNLQQNGLSSSRGDPGKKRFSLILVCGKN